MRNSSTGYCNSKSPMWGCRRDYQLRAELEQIFRTESLSFSVIKSFYVRPFQPNHVERERQVLPREFGMSRKPIFEP